MIFPALYISKLIDKSDVSLCIMLYSSPLLANACIP